MDNGFDAILQEEDNNDEAIGATKTVAPTPAPNPARVIGSTISQASAKRQRLDAKIESAEKAQADGNSIMQSYLIDQGNARREERIRQDLREAERERREAERERCEAS
jgi:hypothetical protein